MFAQVLKIATRMSLFMSGIVFLFRVINSVSFSGIYIWFVYHWAEIKLSFFSSLGYKGIVISFYDHGQLVTLNAAYFVKHPHTLSLISKVESGVGELFSYPTLSNLLVVAALTYFCVFLYFYFQGKKVGSSKHKRGMVLANLKELKSYMKKKKRLGEFNLDGVPLVKDAETSHMLIAGTTGSGKTNALHHLLPQIRGQQQKAIVVDVTGDLTERYFEESSDVILSPGHEKSSHWNPWLDASNLFEYRAMSEAFVGGSKSHDPFWTEAAKGCLSAAFDKLSVSKNIEELVHILLKSDLNQFSHFLKNTSAAPYADEKGERTTVSIRATLASKIQSLEIMSGTRGTFFYQRLDPK